MSLVDATTFRARIGALALTEAGVDVAEAATMLAGRPIPGLGACIGVPSLEKKARRLLLHARQLALFRRAGITQDEEANLVVAARQDVTL